MRNSHGSPISSELLRTFCAVAEAGNVTQSATSLGRTQSAISLQIRKLEDALSVQLFERRARGVVLTADGKRLLPAAHKALTEIDRIGALFPAPLSGQIRVGIPDDYNATLLEHALAAFATRHRNVEVFVRSGCTAGFPDAIRKGELDLAVFSAGPIESDQAFFSEPTQWAATADFVLEQSAPVPLALFDRDCWWRDVATDALNRAGRSWRLAYSSENFTSVKAAISAGLAVGFLAKSALEDSMRILDQCEGFPPLPESSLVLLKSEKASSEISLEMEQAIRKALV